MWRQGSKAVKPVTKEQITAEIKYQASIAPFRLMLKNEQISTEDYRVIDTILTEKYLPGGGRQPGFRREFRQGGGFQPHADCL